ncbi:SpaA isopeptide-forming pilin-related protein [Enterococcus sp. DIV0187]|uniref:SpaA isopeptide-forming pilin-related protein n=1 Tax=Enterococcus sp. DIV0187 TaxID=2774644 RepID=UPI003F249D77
MTKPIQLKRMVPLLLPVVLIIGVLFFYYHGKALKASAPDSLVSVTVENKAVPNDSLETDKETVELAFKAKDTDIFELSYDDTVSIVPLDEEGQEIAHPQLEASDFKKSQALKLFEDRLKTEQSSESKKTKEEDATTETTEVITSEAEKRLPYYQVRKDDKKGNFYFELEKDQVQKVRITRLTTKEKMVELRSLKDTTKKQSMVVFKSTEELKAVEQEQPAAAPVDTDKAEEPPAATETEEPAKSESEEEPAKDAATAKAAIDPKAISTTTPFKVDVDVGKTTGLAPFDTKKEPGYDNSADDDIVRTFDQVSYRVMLGISNIDEKYASLRIRLDTELSDAWRKDSSGQIRQTAEISNGTMTDTGDGTKKSTRSSWVTLSKATGQAYFTETMETFGGVNGDELNPKFTVTIESAELSNGSTETIDQVIDGSVVSYLDDTVYVSAKPLVDVKLTRNAGKNSTFEKVSGTDDKPYRLVTPVAAYVQLKPLPGRTDITSIKGCTYPVGGIEYKLDQKVVYTGGATTKELVIGTETDPVEVIAYDGFSGVSMPNRKFTTEYSSYVSSYQPVSLQGTVAPYGYTRNTYPPTQSYSNLIGIYDTGNPTVENVSSDHSIKISNDDYAPISVGKNKWFFNGATMPSNTEPFSVAAMQVAFPYEYLEKQVGTSSKLDYTLSVSEVTYEGQSQEVDSKVVVSWDRHWPGDMRAFATFLDSKNQPLGSLQSDYRSNGDGVTTQGNSIYGQFFQTSTDPEVTNGVIYGRWNANSLEFEDGKQATSRAANSTKAKQFYYGVGAKIPDDNLRTQAQIEAAYTWYSTVAEAKTAGVISAVKMTYDILAIDGYNGIAVMAPLKATGSTDKDSEGNSNIGITNAFHFTDKNEQTKYSPGTSEVKYTPSKYDDDGKLVSTHYPSGLSWDTLYIAGMTIRPTISTDKKTYAPDETVKWTVDGKVESGSENNHKVQYEVTIPKETQYTDGSAKDHEGNPLPDPVIIPNGDGTHTLKWVLDYMAEGSTYNPKVTFDTSIISSALNFVNNVADMTGKVIAEVWLEEDPSIKDTSIEQLRTSTTDFTVTNSGVIVVDKVVDKPHIESGNEIDPAKPSDTHPTDFTYTVAFKNHSVIPMQNVRVLDVLPYMGDQRGTNFNGSYSLTQVEQLPGSVQGTIWYTNNFVAADMDPNAVVLSSGWYKLGSDMTVLKNARAIMAVYDELEQGKDMSISLTLRPSGQKAGDKYINAPSLNSHLNKFVQGVPSGVRVYGRDLSGVAWYDDSNDGLIGNVASGAAEAFAKDIPVKLYRTSLEVPSYKKELVEESLTGEKFIDASGDSLVKTDANGKYLFENLPEGDYIAEFIIGDKVVQREVRVTKQLVGSDPTKNSKADKDSYQTPKYEQPSLSDVAGLGATDAKHHVTDVNLGLVRPSTIRLFKYATGTATDANGDGKLSEAEKATGTPLSGAEFEVYEGDASTPFATETTDGSGYLNFVKLFPGEHTLIETKAPSGYELIKNPIKVTITEGNQTVKVYQENDKKADLPFTGGNGPLLAILLTASGALIFGFGYMLWYYRTPKKKGGR